MDYRAIAIIDLDIIYNNVCYIKSKIDNNIKIMSIVKADAYGHGLVQVAKKLEPLVDSFGVVTIEEAKKLCQNNITKEILILGEVNAQFLPYVSQNNISLSVYSKEILDRYSDFCDKTKNKLNVHIAINSGMNRLGLEIDDYDNFEKIINQHYFIYKGIYSHFADSKDLEYCKYQNNNFMLAARYFENKHIFFPTIHISSSYRAIKNEFCYNCVRLGILQYNNENYIDTPLQTAMTLKAKIIQIRAIKKDTIVGYNKSYVAKEKMLIACVSIGYADGLPLEIINGKVEFEGEFYDILAVCMDYLIIDLKNNIEIKVGNYINIFGKTLNPYDLAKMINETNYILLSKISNRVLKKYKNS